MEKASVNTDWVPSTPTAKSDTKSNDVGNNTFQKDAFGVECAKDTNLGKNSIKRKSDDQLNEKPKKRRKVKKHWPKIDDPSKPKKNPKHKMVNPKTPKGKTPRRAIPTRRPKKNLKQKTVNPTPKGKTPRRAVPTISPCEGRTNLKRKCNIEPLVDASKLVPTRSPCEGTTNLKRKCNIEPLVDANKLSSCKKKLDFSWEEPSSSVDDGCSSHNDVFQGNNAQMQDNVSQVNSSDFACDQGLINDREIRPLYRFVGTKRRTPRRRITNVSNKFSLVSTNNECSESAKPPVENETLLTYLLSLSTCWVVRKRSFRSRPVSVLRRKHENIVIAEELVEALERAADNVTISDNVFDASVQAEDSQTLATEDIVEQLEVRADNVAISYNVFDASVQAQDEDSQTLATKDIVERLEVAADNVNIPDKSVTSDKVASHSHPNVQKGVWKKNLPKSNTRYVATLTPLKWKKLTPNLDALMERNIQKLECLSINAECNQLVVVEKRRPNKPIGEKRHSQLVLVDIESNGALVPFIDTKKKKRQARVHLDAETRRVWNLKLEKVDRDADEPTHDERENYWEKERIIFSVRIEYFVARMYTVLGDRSFTRWKGSVLDSIIGVFLTQNVNDVLSSSAFMDLVSAYPAVPASCNANCNDCIMDLPSSQESIGSNIVLSEEICNNEIGGGMCTPILTKIVVDPTGEAIDEDEPALTSSNNFNPQVGVESDNGYTTHSQSESSDGKKKKNANGEEEVKIDWDEVRRRRKLDHEVDTADAVNWDAVRKAPVDEIAELIAKRGMHNVLAGKIKNFLEKIYEAHNTLNLEWLRYCSPEESKAYLLSIFGLGLKSVECVRLLCLHQQAFPVDTNIGRILVRLGWVPLQPLPEGLQMHVLNQYPLLDSVQKYIWPRVCHLNTTQLYEFHYQLITAGKVFCTKKSPNCNACPLKGECKHFASAFASSKMRIMGTRERNTANESTVTNGVTNPQLLSLPESPQLRTNVNCEPIIEIPPSPERSPARMSESPSIPIIDLEDCDSDETIRTIRLTVAQYVNLESKALVLVDPDVASIPMPKLKNVERLRTIHQVYELPDAHDLLEEFDQRDPDDHVPYLLAIWPRDESCSDELENGKFVRATIFIPCRTFNRGAFPLNGTYFQINEVFADYETSERPLLVPTDWIYNLNRREICCGKSVSSICRGLTIDQISKFFFGDFICVRAADRKSRGSRILHTHFLNPVKGKVKAAAVQ